MRQDFSDFRDLLNCAIHKILWLYFRTPIAGQDEEIFRERLFCYELYHQLRIVFDEKGFGYWLGGELDKSKHPLIRGDFKPDFVVHEPGFMDKNLCVLEVKPVTGAIAGFAKDITTLATFVTKYEYHAGILLVFGDALLDAEAVRKKLGLDFNALRKLNVFVIWAQNAQSGVVEL